MHTITTYERLFARHCLKALAIAGVVLSLTAGLGKAEEPVGAVRIEPAAPVRSSLPREMLTECLQNGVAAILFGGPVGFSPSTMSMLGCGVGAMSALVAAGAVSVWEQPEVMDLATVTMWDRIPPMPDAAGALRASLAVLASVSDLAGAVFSPVLTTHEPPPVAVARADAPTTDAGPDELVASVRFQPGIGVGWWQPIP